ncbi:MAG: TonB-dependent receptor [Cyclobacteriaceae bacterium]
MRFYLPLLFILISVSLHAQTYEIFGQVVSKETGNPITDATVFVEVLGAQTSTDSLGNYSLKLPEGIHVVGVFSLEMTTSVQKVDLNSNLRLDFILKDILSELEEVEVTEVRLQTNGITRLNAIEGFGIYEAKKNELIILDDFAANKVSNNARQIFAKVPGLNIWESDFAGIQLDIAARGLGPSRTANFNTRQNGYDMSADALGYPESYYMPSMQAVERIEIVRGAASLQYGSQFGGMLNFKLKEVNDKPLEVNMEQAVGSFGLLNSYVSLGGKTDKVQYFSYYQYRQGEGWRPNSSFYSHLGFASMNYEFSERLKVGVEYSFLHYVAQQPGGLRNDDFEQGDIKISHRGRNWFQVSWNLFAATLDYKFSDQTKLNVRSFGLVSGRDALGNLEQIDRIDDPTVNRTLISDQFKNFGSEVRLLHYYNIFGRKSALVVGGRYYNGLTLRQQGDASPEADADFNHLNPNELEDFDYDFPSQNHALFAENIFNLTDKLSITPGLRFEHIRTDATGIWRQIVRDFAGNIKAENTFEDDRVVRRSFLLGGLGVSYRLSDQVNLYTNYSENFRSVTFSDLRLNNPNFLLDSLITDESGFNMDLGVRGNVLDWLNVDVSLFYLQYNDRIGVLLPAGSTLLFRTNVGDSRHFGIESLLEMDVFGLLGKEFEDQRLSLFTNFSLINATYIKSDDNAIKGKQVEYVPNVMFRTGLSYALKDFKATYQFSYMGDQFSDATNSSTNPNALTGLIPAYTVMDISFDYQPGRYKITAGVNNLTNQQYFTRRAESYPGPGIIPATIRSFYLSLGVRI